MAVKSLFAFFCISPAFSVLPRFHFFPIPIVHENARDFNTRREISRDLFFAGRIVQRAAADEFPQKRQRRDIRHGFVGRRKDIMEDF